MNERGDFTATPRLIVVCLISVVIGVLCALISAALTALIAFFTNLFFYGRISLVFRSPALHGLGAWVVWVPAVGGLLIGLMARYGSERIRGHGIPEAMEAILIGRSRMEPKVAVLKPVSSALSIGSGGPFGAEGPIIMTGGAFGSLIAQAFHMTAAERKTLLVAGAAGGMSATFASPVAAVLLAVELLLFEWKPRSAIPVAIASACAAAVRPYLFDAGPLFPVPFHPAIGLWGLLAAIIVGVSAGALSAVLTTAVYAAEDFFQRLPIHWMWWPALGGLVIGIGGLIDPNALGVGYEIIADLVQGRWVGSAILVLMLVKGFIWAVSLGSGTSGGVLAPLLILGGSLGALEAGFLPGVGQGLWPLVSMAAVLGGTMRCPFTAVVFALELTHDVNALLPLLIASTVAYAFTVLLMKRSILTEKVARRGYHLSREYSVDPLELLSVGEVMTAKVATVSPNLTARQVRASYFDKNHRKHQGYPVIDQSGALVGIITRANFLEQPVSASMDNLTIADIMRRDLVVAYPGESCRTAAEHMAQFDVGRLPVVSVTEPTRLLGIVTRSDLLKPRERHVRDEQERERLIRFKFFKHSVTQAQAQVAAAVDPPSLKSRNKNRSELQNRNGAKSGLDSDA
jgi:H+/Cl- antiporter ClcA/CBS domain-containing protein